MVLKRPLNASICTPERPPKRRHVTFSSPPQQPRAASASTSASTLVSFPLSTPFQTPRSVRSASSASSYYSASYSFPSDSPSNPFSFDRAQDLALPQVTSFAKHLALRLEVVGWDPKGKGKAPARPARGRGKARTKPAEMPFRVVQVPTNYTFRHLHALICFLFTFETSMSLSPSDIDDMLFGDLSPELDRSSPRARLPATRPATLPKHTFDVQRDCELYSMSYRPGVIKSGTTRTRLSANSEIWDERPFDFEFPLAGTHDAPASKQKKGKQEKWMWESEDHFHVAKVWPEGPDLSRAVIYVRLCLLPYATSRH
jgi:hypothetical protein